MANRVYENARILTRARGPLGELVSIHVAGEDLNEWVEIGANFDILAQLCSISMAKKYPHKIGGGGFMFHTHSSSSCSPELLFSPSGPLHHDPPPPPPKEYPIQNCPSDKVSGLLFIRYLYMYTCTDMYSQVYALSGHNLNMQIFPWRICFLLGEAFFLQLELFAYS